MTPKKQSSGAEHKSVSDDEHAAASLQGCEEGLQPESRRDDCKNGNADSRSENLAIVVHAGGSEGLSAERGVWCGRSDQGPTSVFTRWSSTPGLVWVKGTCMGLPPGCSSPRQIPEAALGLGVCRVERRRANQGDGGGMGSDQVPVGCLRCSVAAVAEQQISMSVPALLEAGIESLCFTCIVRDV